MGLVRRLDHDSCQRCFEARCKSHTLQFSINSRIVDCQTFWLHALNSSHSAHTSWIFPWAPTCFSDEHCLFAVVGSPCPLGAAIYRLSQHCVCSCQVYSTCCSHYRRCTRP